MMKVFRPITAHGLTRRRRPHHAARGLLALLAAVHCADARAQAEPAAEPAPMKREYLHQQPPDTTLVFRFDSFEAEFESRLSAAGGAPFKISGVPGLRIAPLFQFVEAVATERPLVIEVTLGRRSQRARVDMQLVRFDRSGPDQPLQQRAYRLLSHGLEAAPPERADLWQQKVVSLNEAATLFDRLGMQEPMLWSQFYESHLLLERLGDALSAAENARRVQAEALRSRQHRIHLAALQLEGRALLALASAVGNAATFERARAVFGQAAAQAAEMDLQHERALATFYLGMAHERERRNADAFRAFDEALAITALNGDLDLANAMRRHAAALHEQLGNTEAAIAMMQAIDSGPAPAAPGSPAGEPEGAAPADTRARRDTVRYLYEQGRLLLKAYRPDEAVAVLREALAHSGTGDGAAGPIGLLLGQALFEVGQFDAAAEEIMAALPRTPASSDAAALRDGWNTLAVIRRNRGEHDAAAASREQQARFAATAADHARLQYERGIDAIAAAAPAARQLFRDSLQRAAAAGLDGLADLARLRLCLLAADPCASPGPVSSPAAPEAFASPGEKAEALWLGAQLLQHLGRAGEAAAAVTDLLDEMLFLQSALPGVLGSWYWLERDAVFDLFVTLQTQGPDGIAALRTLAALEAMRAPTADAPLDANQSAAAERVRSLLAARVDSPDPPAGTDAEIVTSLNRLRTAVAPLALAGRTRTLQQRLGNLPADETLLAFYVHGTRAQAYIGRAGSLRMVHLPWDAARTARLGETLAQIRRDPAAAVPQALQALGSMLLQPLPEELGEVVLFLPLGALAGMPLDALELGGRPLATTRRVVNLVALDALARRSREFDSAASQRVFVAGNRREGSGDFSVMPPPSAELRAVAGRFVGPGLTLRQGAALKWEEFQDAPFTAADLLHLAMPAVEDLRDGSRSHFLMSDNADDPERELLYAADLPAPLAARLAVMSNCAFTGSNPSVLGRHGGLIERLLAAGTEAVVASLWPVGDTAAAAFTQRFYAQLDDHHDISAALAATKRSYIADGTAGPAVWAAFQLFID